MYIPGIVIQPTDDNNFRKAVRFLPEGECDGGPSRIDIYAGHSEREDTRLLLATRASDIIDLATILWESSYTGSDTVI